MSSPRHPGIFATIERQCAGSEPTPQLRLFDGSEGAGVPLALVRARQLLYDRSVCPAARVAMWRQVAERFHWDADGGVWPTAVVWLGLPGLRRTAFKITWRFRAERGDVEAELVTCYLEALAEVGAHDPDPGGTVLRSACSRAWNVWRKARPEMAMDDVESAGGAPIGTDTEGYWQADYDPIPRRPGLSATVRITVPAHRVEGVRLGALAQTWGVAGTAMSAGYSGRGRQVAKISLRRVGKS
ncbi:MULTISPECIES: hypothetical protein [Streptomyces]|uniref:hypothetical protein n=1 Tax=Streptomyces TaxID=1883 RepID=UPI0004CD9A87|nr:MULTISPECIES: hypothetical protein [Streptomyces]KOT60078.1 hypothetical protein ADK43_15720 [Streptomyces rimosus subsp. rimosus]